MAAKARAEEKKGAETFHEFVIFGSAVYGGSTLSASVALRTGKMDAPLPEHSPSLYHFDARPHAGVERDPLAEPFEYLQTVQVGCAD